MVRDLAESVATRETPTQFADRLGCAKSYITQLHKDDRLVTEPKGKRWVVLVEASFERLAATKGAERDDVTERWEQHRKKEADLQSKGEDVARDVAAEVISAKQASIAKSEHYKALKTEAEYWQLIGQLADVEAVRRAGAELGTLLRSSLENMQDQLSAELAAESDPARIYAVIGEHHENVLNEISRKLSGMAGGGA